MCFAAGIPSELPITGVATRCLGKLCSLTASALSLLAQAQQLTYNLQPTGLAKDATKAITLHGRCQEWGVAHCCVCNNGTVWFEQQGQSRWQYVCVAGDCMCVHVCHTVPVDVGQNVNWQQ